MTCRFVSEPLENTHVFAMYPFLHSCANARQSTVSGSTRVNYTKRNEATTEMRKGREGEGEPNAPIPCFFPSACNSFTTDVRQSTTVPNTSNINASTFFKEGVLSLVVLRRASDCDCDSGCGCCGCVWVADMAPLLLVARVLCLVCAGVEVEV